MRKNGEREDAAGRAIKLGWYFHTGTMTYFKVNSVSDGVVYFSEFKKYEELTTGRNYIETAGPEWDNPESRVDIWNFVTMVNQSYSPKTIYIGRNLTEGAYVLRESGAHGNRSYKLGYGEIDDVPVSVYEYHDSNQIRSNPRKKEKKMTEKTDRCWRIESEDLPNKYWSFSLGAWVSAGKATKFTAAEKKAFRYMPDFGKWQRIPTRAKSADMSKFLSAKLKRNGLFSSAPKDVAPSTKEEKKAQLELIQRSVEKLDKRPSVQLVRDRLNEWRIPICTTGEQIQKIIDGVFDEREASAKRSAEFLEKRMREKGLIRNGLFSSAPKDVPHSTKEEKRVQVELIQRSVERMDKRPSVQYVRDKLNEWRMPICTTGEQIQQIIDGVFDEREASAKRAAEFLENRMREKGLIRNSRKR